MADEHPDIVEELERHCEEWWHSVEPSLQRINLFPVVGEKTPAVELCLFDWDDYEGDANNTVQLTVREGARMFGDWHIEVEEAGDYLFEMRRWPREAETAIAAGLPEYQAEDDLFSAGVSLPITQADLTVEGQNRRITVSPRDEAARVKLRLERGKTTIQCLFRNENGDAVCGVYYLAISNCRLVTIADV